MKLSALALGLVSAASVIAGCPDTQAVFDDYIDRSEPFRVVPVTGVCEGAVDVSGRFLMGAAVAVDPSKPIRFEADFEVDGDGLTVGIRALAVAGNADGTPDGEPVGERYEASGTIDAEDGSFTLDFGTIVVVAAGNPILPAPVTADLVLAGCTASETFSCGVVSGAITSPALLPLDGSSWAITRWDTGVGLETLTLVTGCPAE